MKKSKFILPILGLSTIATTVPFITCCNQSSQTNEVDPIIKAKAYANITNAVTVGIAYQPEAEFKLRSNAQFLYKALDEATITEQCIAIDAIGSGTGVPITWQEEWYYSWGIIMGIAIQPEAEGKLRNMMLFSLDIIMKLKDPGKIYAIGVGTADAFCGITSQPEAEGKIIQSWLDMLRHVLMQ